MAPPVIRALRSRWFTGSVHACLWLLLYLAITNLGGKAFDYGEVNSSTNPLRDPVPVAALDRLFSPNVWPKALGDTNAPDPFFTTHFIPPQSAPPTTRIIEVTYQGFYQAGDGPKNVIVKLGDTYTAAAVGTKLANSLFVADAALQSLTLTNSAAKTNIVPLNVKKEIVVPIQ